MNSPYYIYCSLLNISLHFGIYPYSICVFNEKDSQTSVSCFLSTVMVLKLIIILGEENYLARPFLMCWSQWRRELVAVNYYKVTVAMVTADKPWNKHKTSKCFFPAFYCHNQLFIDEHYLLFCGNRVFFNIWLSCVSGR